MIVGLGTDVVDLNRVVRLMGAGSERFLAHWFTPDEVAYCQAKAHPARHLAARLAAKEAVSKALRLEFDRTVPWRDIEVVIDSNRAPTIALHGSLALRMPAAGRWHVSLSHSDEHATAVAILEVDRIPDASVARPVRLAPGIAPDPVSASLRALDATFVSTGDPQLDAVRAAIRVEDVAGVVLSEDQIDPAILTGGPAVQELRPPTLGAA